MAANVSVPWPVGPHPSFPVTGPLPSRGSILLVRLTLVCAPRWLPLHAVSITFRQLIRLFVSLSLSRLRTPFVRILWARFCGEGAQEVLHWHLLVRGTSQQPLLHPPYRRGPGSRIGGAGRDLREGARPREGWGRKCRPGGAVQQGQTGLSAQATSSRPGVGMWIEAVMLQRGTGLAASGGVRMAVGGRTSLLAGPSSS